MGQHDALINAANKAIDNAYILLGNNNTPFNVMYKQYKTLQSLWFRVIEDASDSNNRRLEDLCVDLEDVIQKCEGWIKKNSPTARKSEESNNKEGSET